MTPPAPARLRACSAHAARLRREAPDDFIRVTLAAMMAWPPAAYVAFRGMLDARILAEDRRR